VHQSIIVDRLRLALDADLAMAVMRATAALAHPALVCDVAIGQSTLATQRVKANLFYRGLAFHRFPVIGDTLFTRTEVVGLKQNSAKPGREPTGVAALRMTTIDQIGRLVLDFHRCAMLPLRVPPLTPATPTTCRRSGRTRDWRPIRPPTGTPTHSAPGCRAPTSIPASPARCCTAPPTSSAVPPNWPG
jgi:acyl dehydratase